MNKKNYIDKIELILNTSGKYITRKERDMILDYANYFKTKNNVIEDKNIELVIEIERLNNIINQIESIVYADISNIDARITIQEVLDKELKGSNK